MTTKKKADKKSAPRVIVEIRGGVCVAIYSDQELDWEIMDRDEAATHIHSEAYCQILEEDIKKRGLKDVTEID